MMLGIPSLTESPRHPPADKAEPRLFPESAPRPFREPAIADAVTPAATGTERQAPVVDAPVTSPTIAAPDGRLVPAAAGLPAGTLLCLALVGLVATLIIGAFFGAGFLLRATPQKADIAASEPNSVPPSAPIPHEQGPPVHAPTAVAIPVSSPMQHPAASTAAPLPPIKTAQGVPPPPADSAPLTPTAPTPAQSHPAAAAAPRSAATATPSPPAHPAPRQSAKSRPPRLRRVAHTRSESRHPPVRSARSDRSPAPPRPRVAQSVAPSEAGQTHAFDQLLTQLTGPTGPRREPSSHTSLVPPFSTAPASTAPSLTPPGAGQPDPFDRDAGTDRGGSAPVQ
jgi:hypothetical protein